ncbi:hypothetical protein [Chryseobacterium populi]|uniref:Sel1 repeat protein n=1 Tax=Chryseobacterium populi TaxID=1144316 RepID=J2JUE1_9FLAO|nr:hypothetical protein [Chryseobacterium populi]EJL71480.1 hypothetical protein PMI13_02326 [Chryseobacterium populi]
MKKIIILNILLLLISCNKKEKTKETTSPSSIKNSETTDKYLNDAILKGDTIAYIRAYKAYSIHGRDEEFLYYAIKMAEEHQYPFAYENVYTILSTISDEKGYNKKSKIGEYYLLRAYELGNAMAKERIKWKYSDENKKIPTSRSVLEN